MAKLFKKGQVSATRAYQIADSLKKESRFDLDWSNALRKSASNEKSKTVKDILLKSADQADKRLMYNYKKADRIEKAADAAMNKAKGRDIPLPSSDKLM